MLYFLENDYFKVGIESMGAELQHFIKKDEDLELIWVGDPTIWGSHAPNLFPIVGELPAQQYTFDGHTYHMNRHGFARKKEFELIEEKDSKLVFQLKDDEETLEQYPFKFRLLVAYKLNDNKLEVTYQVLNENKKAMWFSVGAHPGFNVPLYNNEQYTDYYLEFEQEETLRRYLIDENGLQTGETELINEQTKVLPLNHRYFDKDAIILKELNSESVILASHNGPRKIEISFQGFPYLGIWAKPGPSPYICIEPWCGIASSNSGGTELQEKEGINELAPKQVFERTYSIQVW